MPAYSLLKNSVLSVLLWKSGPSGPRKLLKINLGFSPRAAEPSFQQNCLAAEGNLRAYLIGSSTSRCALAASTAFALKGKGNVVPSYHAFHWSI